MTKLVNHSFILLLTLKKGVKKGQQNVL